MKLPYSKDGKDYFQIILDCRNNKLEKGIQGG
jgi:hypothetical protein